MAQRLKPAIRARIVDAAGAEFLANGYTGAHLSAIAARAGLSTGNLYRYFPGKTELFLAVAPRATAAQLLCLTRSRVRELATLSDWRLATETGSDHAARLLRFWIDNRVAVSILLKRAEGSPLEQVRPLLERYFVEGARRRSVSMRTSDIQELEARSFVMQRIFEATLDILASILSRFESEAAIRRAVAAFWTYQLAGLEAVANDPPAESA